MTYFALYKEYVYQVLCQSDKNLSIYSIKNELLTIYVCFFSTISDQKLSDSHMFEEYGSSFVSCGLFKSTM